MQLKLGNPAALAAPPGPYSHTVEVPGGATLLFVSGQIPLGLDGSLAPTLAEQADQVYANLVAALADRGAPPSAIIKLTTFMVDDDPEFVVGRARRRHLGDHRPASTVLWVKRLVDPSWKLEIEAVAIVPEKMPEVGASQVR